MEELDDLVKQAQSGDQAAFNAIVRQYQDMAVGYAYSHLSDFHLAEDAAQEAFIGAYLNLSKLRQSAAFPGWFRRVILTHCNRLTRRKRLPTVGLEAALGVAWEGKRPDELVEEQDLKDRVLTAVQALPEHERTVITLFYISQLSQKEIADFLELSAATVNNRLHAARKRLKKELAAVARTHLRNQRPSRNAVFAAGIQEHLTLLTEEDTEMSKELDFIADLLGGFLAKEDPQSVAKILSRLDTTLKVVLGGLPAEMQGEVVHHLFQLRADGFNLLRWTADDLGGVKAVTKILNRSRRETERDVLVFVDKHDPKLAEEMRNQMFVFEDIAYLNDQAIQLIMMEWEPRDFAIALKGASEVLKNRILSNASERIGKEIREAMASLGPVRKADVEDIHLQMVITVRQLHEAGQITIESASYIP